MPSFTFSPLGEVADVSSFNEPAFFFSLVVSRSLPPSSRIGSSWAAKMGLEKCCVGQEEKGWEREESTGHAAMRERGGQQSYGGQSSMEKEDPTLRDPGERFACVDGLIWMTGRLLGCKSRGWGLGRRWCLRPAASRTGCGMSTNRMVWMTGVAGKQPGRCTYAVAREGIRNQPDTRQDLKKGGEKRNAA